MTEKRKSPPLSTTSVGCPVGAVPAVTPNAKSVRDSNVSTQVPLRFGMQINLHNRHAKGKKIPRARATKCDKSISISPYTAIPFLEN
jgi:hypothetical protein